MKEMYKKCFENCLNCGGELRGDSLYIEFIGNEEWLECLNCGEMYDLDGNIIEED